MSRRKECPGHYYGLRAIADRLGCSTYGVTSKILKLHFPAFHLPSTNASGGFNYVWYTNEQLINQWSNRLIETSRDKLLRSKTARNMMYTREPDQLTGTDPNP